MRLSVPRPTAPDAPSGSRTPLTARGRLEHVSRADRLVGAYGGTGELDGPALARRVGGHGMRKALPRVPAAAAARARDEEVQDELDARLLAKIKLLLANYLPFLSLSSRAWTTRASRPS